jgi:hypothetical protein
MECPVRGKIGILVVAKGKSFFNYGLRPGASGNDDAAAWCWFEVCEWRHGGHTLYLVTGLFTTRLHLCLWGWVWQADGLGHVSPDTWRAESGRVSRLGSLGVVVR